MRRMSWSAILVLGLAAVGGADEAPKKVADAKAVEGLWDVLTIESPNPDPEGPPKNMKFEFKNGTMTMLDGERKIRDMGYKIDASKNPINIDLTMKGGPKEETGLGILEVKGDELKMCVEFAGKERPKEFKAGDKKSDRAVITLKRSKK